MARVKICGINTAQACRAAVEAGAEWIGLNFYQPSPRAITGAQARAIAGEGAATRVGLFVEPDAASIGAVLAQVDLDVLQLYADAATCRALRAQFTVPVWRAVGVSVAADLPADDEGLDGFVIEAKAPKGADRPGGNAVSFDWTITHGWRAPAFWMLAGGLTPDNIGAAIAASGTSAVDVSSGVETAPGVKSAALIEAFVNAAR